MPPNTAANRRALVAIKLLHTLVWGLFAGCIVALPFASLLSAHRTAAWLAAIVAVEVVILLLHRWSCPLTPIAARYTDDRSPNFDIYLPRWLAQHNKVVFGTLYVGGLLFAAWRWAASAT